MLEETWIPFGGSIRHLSSFHTYPPWYAIQRWLNSSPGKRRRFDWVGPQSVQRNGPYQVASNPKVNGAVTQRPHTLDSLFANMKEQRMRVQAQTGRRPRNYAAQRRKFYGRQRNFVGRQINYMGRQRSN